MAEACFNYTVEVVIFARFKFSRKNKLIQESSENYYYYNGVTNVLEKNENSQILSFMKSQNQKFKKFQTRKNYKIYSILIIHWSEPGRSWNTV